MFRSLLTAALLFTSPALAIQHDEPPARYANAFKGKLIVHTVPKGGASKLCRTLEQSEGGGFAGSYIGMLGCSFGGIGTDTPNECVIVVTEGKPHVKRHEIAHCAGWPANHPQ